MVINDEHLTTLLSDCARRDHKAFERLYEAAAPKLFSVCRHMMKQDELAEEALQETFIQVWRDAGDYKSDRAKPMTWLAVIARHRCLDLLRRRKNNVSLDDDEQQFAEPVDEGLGPLELAAQHADQYALNKCLQTLSEQQRISVTMAFYRGFSHQQLSSYLATPIGTVKSWVRRGLAGLKRCLQQ